MAESSNLNDQKPQLVSGDGADPRTESAPSSKAESDTSPDVVVSQDAPAAVPEDTTTVILERLARQVEYYFSAANLERDTYVATLRSLNDGYVPITIIANFGKVKELVQHDALNAVRKAATQCSELLEVVHIDKETGKRLDNETASTSPHIQTVEAVGPKSREPIPMSSIATIPASAPVIKPMNSPSISVQNTLIIREVPEGTQESEIRELFTFKKCPQIQDLRLDIANCWFVTLDTSSKDDMINVMLELRTKKFACGDSVKARLKSAFVMNPDVSPVNYVNGLAFPPQLYGGHEQIDIANKKTEQGGKRKKNGPNASNKGKNTNVQNKNVKGAKNNGNSQRSNNNNDNIETQQSKKSSSPRQDGKPNKAPSQKAPTLGEDQFPPLPSDDLASKNKIEVEKVPDHRPDDMDKAPGSSDSASTATTTSSSSSSKNASTTYQPIGYAAALLKAAPPMKTKPLGDKEITESNKGLPLVKKGGNNISEKNGPSNPKDRTIKKNNARSSSVKKSSGAETASPGPVSVQPPTWGGGRSFAAVVAAAPKQLA